MSCYVIGDLQGCYQELKDLLKHIAFNPSSDKLIFAGDIINRGPESLACLRFVMDNDFADMVLGNHDLHLLAVIAGVRKPHRKDTLDEILVANDIDDISLFLRQQKLLIHDKSNQVTIVHAGISPQWSLKQARQLSDEVHAVLSGDDFEHFIGHIYGNEPTLWQESLRGNRRYRFIINTFTRMRYCHADGSLDFAEKKAPGQQSKTLKPWFQFHTNIPEKHSVIFGHWSTVMLGNINDFSQYHVIPLDTGCLWGGHLTAIRLEDKKLFSVPSRQ